MAQEKFCQECTQRHAPLETPKKSLTGHDCREVYQQLGKAEGPSVVFKVVAAFLLPLMVFIAALAASEKILAKVISSKEAQTALSFLLALAVTLSAVGCSLLAGIGKSKIKMQRAKLQSKIQKAKLTTNQHESDTNFFRRD